MPDVVAPPPKHPRFPLSEGIRGVAAIAVVVVHSWMFAGRFGDGSGLANRLIVRLDTMVAIFFLLSAFLLYRPMIAHRAGGPRSPRVRDYARRRFLRIYPAYWLALTLLAIYPGVSGVFSSEWWSFYSLSEYLHPVTSSSICPGAGYRCGLLQSWTLTVEMTFYFVLPLFAALTALIARRLNVRSWMRAELALIVALGGLSLCLDLLPFGLREKSWFTYTFAAHFDWLGLGLGLAVLSSVYGRREADLPRPLRLLAENPGACWSGAILLYLITVVAFQPVPFTVAQFTNTEFLGLHLLQCGIAFLVVFPVFFGNPNVGLPRRILATPWLVWLGLVSYGFYLWQVTIGIELGFGNAQGSFLPVVLGTVLIALPLAAASYYLIERPLMQWKYKSFRKSG
ncbi:MAG: acyltransferase family protein [Solirubrobacterales bacterium]